MNGMRLVRSKRFGTRMAFVVRQFVEANSSLANNHGSCRKENVVFEIAIPVVIAEAIAKHRVALEAQRPRGIRRFMCLKYGPSGSNRSDTC